MGRAMGVSHKLKQWAKLNRPWSHRLSLLKTMVTQLIEKERIRTTVAKAQALQRFTDRVITLGKKGTREAYDKASGIVRTDRELHKLFTTYALRYKDRQGGYTRIVNAGFRERDSAPVAIIEFVDRPDELRPANPPKHISPLLPPAVQAYLQQQQQLEQRQPHSARQQLSAEAPSIMGRMRQLPSQQQGVAPPK